MGKDNAVNLLWTGGWDSTFRLLELLLIQKKSVQPYYVIDSQRRSTGVELLRRDQIKGQVIERDPQLSDLCLPTIFQDKEKIKPNQELTKHYQNILKRQGLGGQHHWLALFADEKKSLVWKFAISKMIRQLQSSRLMPQKRRTGIQFITALVKIAAMHPCTIYSNISGSRYCQ